MRSKTNAQISPTSGIPFIREQQGRLVFSVRMYVCVEVEGKELDKLQRSQLSSGWGKQQETDYCSEGIAALSEYHLFKRIMCLCTSIVVVENIKKNVIGAGELLRALAAFPKDPGRIPRTHMGTHNCLSQQSQGNPQPLSDFYGHCISEVHSSLFRQKTHTHKNNE